MNTSYLRRITGLMLIVVPLAFVIGFTLLQIMFDYPAILRQPTAEVLTKFQAAARS